MKHFLFCSWLLAWIAIDFDARTLAVEQAEVKRARYQIKGDSVYLAQAARDEDLAALRDVKGIRSLGWAYVISGTPGPYVTNQGLSNIAGWTELEALELPNYLLTPYLEVSYITDEGLKHFKELKNLKKLDLSGHRITDAGLENIADLKNLESLRLRSLLITELGLTHLRGLTGLKQLDLEDVEVTGKSFGYLEQMTELEDLTIGSMSLLDSGMPSIDKFRKLKQLSLRAEITDQGISHLENLTELKTLQLTAHITDASFERLIKLRNLEQLSLTSMSITGKNIEQLAKLPKLRKLVLGGTELRDPAFQKLAVFPSLKSLELKSTPITEAGIEQLKFAMPNLKVSLLPDKPLRPQPEAETIFSNPTMWIEWVRTSDPDQRRPMLSTPIAERSEPQLSIKLSDRIELLAISSDSQYLISSCFPKGLRIHDIAMGNQIAGSDVFGSPHAMAVSHDGTKLVVGYNREMVRLLDAKSLATREEFAVTQRSVSAVALTRDNRVFASGCRDGTLQVWDVPEKRLNFILGQNGPGIKSLAFSGDGKLLAALDLEGQLNVWDLSDGTLFARNRSSGGGDSQVCFSADGKTLAVVTNWSIRLWNTESKVTDVIPAPTQIHGKWKTAVSPGLSTAATVDTKGTIFIWATRTGRIMRTLKSKIEAKSLGSNYRTFAFSRDGQLLATGSDDGRIDLWRTR